MKKLIAITMAVVLLLALTGGPAVAAKPAITYTPHTPSQHVACKLVDNALAKIPHGDGISPVTDVEVGPGGWRYNSVGKSFVTFEYTLDASGTGYTVIAGRSNVAGNTSTINDYPAVLDLPQSPLSGAIVFSGKRGEIVLTGDSSIPPLFALPGQGAGQVRINLYDPDGDGVYEGCAMRPMLKNFGFVVPEGGAFVQREYFKAYAMVDATTGTVIFFEWTEISTFNNTVPGLN